MFHRRVTANTLLVVLCSVLSLARPVTAECQLQAAGLKTNTLSNPVLQDTVPRLSWRLAVVGDAAHEVRNASQSSYSVRCLGADGSVLWDTGRVDSAETLQIIYAGLPLLSRQVVHWSVVVWNERGEECAASTEVATFEMALLDQADWAPSEWLTSGDPLPTDDCAIYDSMSSPRFRSEFAVPTEVRSARLYVTGLGYFQCWLNGRRIGDARLDPGLTTFASRVLYAVHDVSAMLSKDAANALGCELGAGFFDPLPLRFWGQINLRDSLSVVGPPMLRLQLELAFEDGSTALAVASTTSSGWQVSTAGPTRFNSVYLGEHFDATAEQPGWAEAGFDATGWRAPRVGNSTGLGSLQVQEVPPIRRQSQILAKKLSARSRGPKGASVTTVLLDAGKNMGGVCEFAVRGPSGSNATMLYGEILFPNGTSVNRKCCSGIQIET